MTKARYAVGVALLVFPAAFLFADTRVSIYDGTTEGIKLGSWGNGKADISKAMRFLGKPALEIQARGLYEGGCVELSDPFELDPFLNNPSGSYLVAIVRTQAKAPRIAAGAAGRAGRGLMQPGAGAGMPMPPMMGGQPMPGGPGMMGPPGMGGQGMMGAPGMPGMPGMGVPPGEMMPGAWQGQARGQAQGQGGAGRQQPGVPGMPGMGIPPGEMMPGAQPGQPGMPGAPGMPGMPGMPGGPGMPGAPGMPEMPGMPGMGQGAMPGMPGAARKAQPTVHAIRVLLVTDQGLIDCGLHKIDPTAVDAEGWLRVVIPVDEMHGPGKVAGAKVERVAFFADRTGKFYLGRVWMVQEDTPLLADPGPRRRRVKVGQDVRFEAAPQPSGVRARYTWDFDDLDGITEDAVGPSTTWKFEEAGYYVVTLTVKDLSGSLVPKIAHVYVLAEK